MSHVTVLLNEAVEALNIKPNGVYVDGTFGRGGHSRAILAALGPHGRLIAIDKDPEAIEEGRRLAAEDPRFEIHHLGFESLEPLARECAVMEKVDGILLDLGVSSPQLDTAERGFSFMKAGPLDMRMDPTTGQSAAEWLAVASEEEMTQVFKFYGEEKFGKRIARAILTARAIQPIDSTTALVNVIVGAVPKVERHKHPATRTFQAIRIFINRELDELTTVLDQCLGVLGVGGRLVVISFHSLEDRIVKRYIRRQSESSVPSFVPIKQAELGLRMKKIGKAVKASEDEVAANPRSRSAIMRVGEKIL